MAARTRAPSSLRLAGAAAAVCVLAACSSGAAPAAPPSAPAQPPPTAAPPAAEATTAAPGASAIEVAGTLAAPEQAQGAFTYNPQLAPADAEVEAAIVGNPDGTTEVSLDVDGMLPNRGYAAHVHARPCGATGADAGPHYQNRVDPAATPEKPSSDPAYANPENEVWLDLRTDASGVGSSEVEVPFTFTDRRPGSVVIHEAEMTMTGPGQAGMAGGRLACLTIPPA